MKYGFVIDNRKCIGCHACTTACKAEHEVPVGVNRTWVKQVEKGEFPDTRRLFSVMRCNHCTDAPCVTICPTEALFIREDGIVDFDKDRCIGCKSCMQACPYDALYIDPETHTAAKCNYCAHRIDVGLEPACVNVCPEHAIISGDMENPETEIAQLLSRHPVTARKAEKGTNPNLFYIDADEASLVPAASEKLDVSLWSSQSHGVGHFAKEAEKLANTNVDLLGELYKFKHETESVPPTQKAPRTVQVVMDQAKEVYNTPDKGILWGWEVSAYVWTKAISAGAILVLVLALLTGSIETTSFLWAAGSIVGLVFLTLTGALLVKDLDQPFRFAYVLLRPHWSSWLVKGGYAITIYGGLLALILAALYFEWTALIYPAFIAAGVIASIVAIYTAFLFAQAKGRDFWQSPTMAIHMFVHSFMAGVAVYLLITLGTTTEPSWQQFLVKTGMIAIFINLFTLGMDLSITHPTQDAKEVVNMILKGRYKTLFWIGTILIGNVLPLLLFFTASDSSMLCALAGILTLVGVYINNHIWVEAPQRIALS